MKRVLFLNILILIAASPLWAQIFHVARMNTEQIRALDRQKTVVILTGGILEQHGPHLPSFSDGYSNEWLAQRLAEAITARKGAQVLMFPTIPLGHEGANEIGAKFVFPGTYSIRRSTLRAIFMDLATELGEQGFKNVFIVHGHGAPYHNLMLDQSGEYFRDVYAGRMVHLRGLEPSGEQLARLKIPAFTPAEVQAEERKEIGLMDEHAGYDETSRLLFLRPDLVAPDYLRLAPQTVNNPVEFFSVARMSGWAGYLSSPRLANAAAGAVSQQRRSAGDIALALAILDGSVDEREIPRYGRRMTSTPEIMSELAGSSRNDLDRERKQREWLRKKGVE